VSSKEDIQRLAREVEAHEPHGIQLLVNNVGIVRDDATKFSSSGEPDMSSATAISEHFMKSEVEAWEDTFRTNTTGAFFASMAFLPLLAKGGERTKGYSSQVINVSSISGQMKGSSRGQFAYTASKAAITHLSRMLATTFKGVGVKVNVIAPGLFPSEVQCCGFLIDAEADGRTDDRRKSGDDQKSALDVKPSNPAGRTGNGFDMSATVLFLAGPGGLFYNEQILYPDRGEHFQFILRQAK
jgi:NAD(P)-dependent dehydrogenase (short-subunit alcohol dehydrogenase family)